MVKPDATGTRDRLVDAALQLVAAHGFDGVSVGDIEAGAGLAPRSGALYKYFDSKLAVLEAGLERHLASIADFELDLEGSPLDDVGEVEGVARSLLDELDRERTITHVIEREGDRLPDLRDRMRAGVSDRGYRMAAMFVERWTSSRGLESSDTDALAVLLIGGMINLRRSTWTFGAPPLDVDDERIISAFVEISESLLRRG